MPYHHPTQHARGAAPLWTPKEKLTLRTLWKTATWAELQEALPGRTAAAIKEYATKFGCGRRPPHLGRASDGSRATR